MAEKVTRQDLTREQISTLRKNQREAGLLRNKSSHEVNGFSTLISIVFVIAVFMTLSRLFINPNSPIFSFEYLLDVLGRVPKKMVDISWLTEWNTLQNKYIPSALKWFTDIFWVPFSFLIWFSSGIINIIIFIFYFVGAIFGLA